VTAISEYLTRVKAFDSQLFLGHCHVYCIDVLTACTHGSNLQFF